MLRRRVGPVTPGHQDTEPEPQPGIGGAVQNAPARRCRDRRPDRRLVAGCATVFVVLLVTGTWIAVRGLLARSHLDAARAQIARLQAAVSVGEVPTEPELRRMVTEIAAQTAAARSLTSDPLWSAAGAIPALGCPLRTAATLTAALDDVAARGLSSVVSLGDLLDPTTLRDGMTVNVKALAEAGTPAERARDMVRGFTAEAGRTAGCGWLGRATGVAEARDEAVAQGDRLYGALDSLALASRLGPPMLGAEETRRYLLIVQNPSESRANGGIVGGYGLLTATEGRLELDDISGNGSLPGGPTLARPATELPAEFMARYGAFWPARVWANVNLTPDYPTAGRIYSEMYRAATGVRVDGTISLDPTTLSYLLAASAPAVLPDGRVVRADELVELVESRVYEEIDDVRARDEFFATVGDAVYQSVTSAGNTPKLLRALERAVREGRLLVSTNHPEEQETIAATPLGGALVDVDGPFLAVVTQNASASKLDYWMRRRTSYRMERQPDGSGFVTITIRITNAAPEGLSAYVRNRSDLAEPWANPDAQNNLWVSVYTGRESWFVGARLDGEPVALTGGREKGRPVLSTYLTVDRGQTRTLQLRVLEREAGPALTLRTQPLTHPERVVVGGIPVAPRWSRNVNN